MDTAEIAASVKFISNPNLWPRWPMLPLKRNTKRETEAGYLFGDPQIPLVIHIGNIYTAKKDDPTLTYENAEAAILDGWRVD